MYEFLIYQKKGGLFSLFVLIDQFSPVSLALCGTLFTWGVTALGAAMVFCFRRVGKKLLDSMLGFSGGVMIAASFWSLLLPAKELCEAAGRESGLSLSVGFLAGGFLLLFGDLLFERKNEKMKRGAETPEKGKSRCRMLLVSVTLHNIPEGMAVGVAFGSAALGLEGATLTAACILTLGIGLQNFPEGTAVSLPLFREGMSPGRAFFFGQLSGAVEPIGAIFGAWLVLTAKRMLPFLLSFAAGAMIYVVISELIPACTEGGKSRFAPLSALFGFALMMALDVILGT